MKYFDGPQNMSEKSPFFMGPNIRHAEFFMVLGKIHIKKNVILTNILLNNPLC